MRSLVPFARRRIVAENEKPQEGEDLGTGALWPLDPDSGWGWAENLHGVSVPQTTEGAHFLRPTVEQALFRHVMGLFVTGVTVISAIVEGRPVGMTAQSFVSLSLDPPLVMVCPSRYSSTWRLMEATGVLCINVLSSGQEATSRRFASKTDERFHDVRWNPAPTTGSPLLEDVHAWVDCSIEDVHPGGDHLIAVCRVLALGAPDERGNPLVFYTGRYGEVAGGNLPNPPS